MATGTDKEILGAIKKRVKPGKASNGGRPQVNRPLVIRLLKSTTPGGDPRYNLSQIARMAECSRKTVQRIRDEALTSGDLQDETRDGPALNTVEADFEAECQRARGMSFIGWLQSEIPSAHKRIFSFTEKCWVEVWDRVSLVDVADFDSNVGDQMAQKWLEVFGEDRKRLRARKKLIRYIFRFLRRKDICDMHLTMNNVQDPRAKRNVPFISMTDFPMRFERCLKQIEEMFPGWGRFIIEFKTVGQMRTGGKKKGTDIFGIRKGVNDRSYLLMSSPDEYRCHIWSKRSEEWDMNWIPRKTRVELWEKYVNTDDGDFIIPIPKKAIREAWGDITEQEFGFRFILHDCRKISLTWFYVLGIPLEICTNINVGWLDLSTAFDHYLNIRRILKKSVKDEYGANIPDWFKDGLQEFTTDDNVILNAPESRFGGSPFQ